jgi:hypothetical protein
MKPHSHNYAVRDRSGSFGAENLISSGVSTDQPAKSNASVDVLATLDEVLLPALRAYSGAIRAPIPEGSGH